MKQRRTFIIGLIVFAIVFGTTLMACRDSRDNGDNYTPGGGGTGNWTPGGGGGGSGGGNPGGGGTHSKSWSVWTVITVADCTTPGLQSRTCGVCSVTQTQVIPAAGHTVLPASWTNIASATCEANGILGGECIDCSVVATQSELPPARGHHVFDSNGFCDPLPNAVCHMIDLVPPSGPGTGAFTGVIPGGTMLITNGTGDTNQGHWMAPVYVSDFYMSRYMVTQGLFEQIMGFNPSFHTEPDGWILPIFLGPPRFATETNIMRRPVDRVTWYDAIEFSNRLSDLHGLTRVYEWTSATTTNAAGNIIAGSVTKTITNNGFRLPTAAEFQFALRGGAGSRSGPLHIPPLNPAMWNGSFHFGNNINDATNQSALHTEHHAWTGLNTDRTRQVGLSVPNSLGIYDMIGNVSEWVWDLAGSPLPAGGPFNNPLGAGGNTNDTVNTRIRGNNAAWETSSSGVFLSSSMGATWPHHPGTGGSGFGFRVVRRP